jgi:hypothetical protein
MPVGEEPVARCRVGLSRYARLFAPVTVLLAVPSLASCGSSAPTLNTVAVEHAIVASIRTQRHLHATVRCPAKVAQRTGLVFTCTANLEVGTYPVTVTETNGAGHVRYTNAAPLIVLRIASVEQAIKRSILSQRRLAATVRCPAEVIQKAGAVFTCTAKVGGRSYPFSVTEIDGNGHVRFVGHHSRGATGAAQRASDPAAT